MPISVPLERIVRTIYVLRGVKVMLDSDLADLYGITTKRLNEQLRRNSDRFPPDFAFQLTGEEWANLRSQIATSSLDHGGRRYMPWAFTEHGALMLSSVLRTPQATRVGLAVVRAFVALRQLLATHEDVARKLAEHDAQIAHLWDHVQRLVAWPEPKKNPIGFVPIQEEEEEEE